MPHLRSTTTPESPRDNERGAVAVVVALFMLIFVALLAFVVDFGVVYATKAKLQNAADAAALAGAQDIACGGGAGTSATTAVTYAQSNGVPVGGTIVSPGSNSISVLTRERVNMVFGQVIRPSQPYIDVEARATATLTCQTDYVVFGENLVNTGSNGQKVGAIYAGAKFTMSSAVGLYISSVSVYVAGPATPGDKSDAIDWKATTPTNIGTRVYGVNGGAPWTAAAYAATTGIPKLITDANKGQVKGGRCDAITKKWLTDNPTGWNIVCDGGDLTIDSDFAGSIVATDTASGKNADIVIKARVTGPLIYTADGDIGAQGGIGEVFGTFYAPNGTVGLNGKGNPKTDFACSARAVGKTVDVDGVTITQSCNPGGGVSTGTVSLTQ